MDSTVMFQAAQDVSSAVATIRALLADLAIGVGIPDHYTQIETECQVLDAVQSDLQTQAQAAQAQGN